MAAFDQGALAKYNSLTDRHLMNYFSNDRMRRHLIKSGLIKKDGEVVPDNMYRIRIARREHRRHVRDVIAQAIVHKALEMERSRQIDIRQKIEEIAKVELVRRVRTDSNRVADDECLTYFNEGDMDVKSRLKKAGSRSLRSHSDLDENRRPTTPDKKSRHRLRKILPNEEIETKHLSPLDSLTLSEYAKILEKHDRDKDNKLPYLGTNNTIGRRKTKPLRLRQNSKSAKDFKSRKTQKREIEESTLVQSARSSQDKSKLRTMVSILFHAPSTNRPFEVMVEQQPSGSNTLTLHKESMSNNTVFQVTSHRHKGFPFSLTFYIDNVKDSRISTCCEYKHKVGKRIGGPTGHFTLFSVEGGDPCFKCLAERDMKIEKEKSKSKERMSNGDGGSVEHETVSVQSTSEDRYKSDDEFESDDNSSNEKDEDKDEKLEPSPRQINYSLGDQEPRKESEDILVKDQDTSENDKTFEIEVAEDDEPEENHSDKMPIKVDVRVKESNVEKIERVEAKDNYDTQKKDNNHPKKRKKSIEIVEKNKYENGQSRKMSVEIEKGVVSKLKPKLEVNYSNDMTIDVDQKKKDNQEVELSVNEEKQSENDQTRKMSIEKNNDIVSKSKTKEEEHRSYSMNTEEDQKKVDREEIRKAKKKDSCGNCMESVSIKEKSENDRSRERIVEKDKHVVGQQQLGENISDNERIREDIRMKDTEFEKQDLFEDEDNYSSPDHHLKSSKEQNKSVNFISNVEPIDMAKLSESDQSRKFSIEKVNGVVSVNRQDNMKECKEEISTSSSYAEIDDGVNKPALIKKEESSSEEEFSDDHNETVKKRTLNNKDDSNVEDSVSDSYSSDDENIKRGRGVKPVNGRGLFLEKVINGTFDSSSEESDSERKSEQHDNLKSAAIPLDSHKDVLEKDHETSSSDLSIKNKEIVEMNKNQSREQEDGKYSESSSSRDSSLKEDAIETKQSIPPQQKFDETLEIPSADLEDTLNVRNLEGDKIINSDTDENYRLDDNINVKEGHSPSSNSSENIEKPERSTNIVIQGNMVNESELSSSDREMELIKSKSPEDGSKDHSSRSESSKGMMNGTKKVFPVQNLTDDDRENLKLEIPNDDEDNISANPYDGFMEEPREEFVSRGSNQNVNITPIDTKENIPEQNVQELTSRLDRSNSEVSSTLSRTSSESEVPIEVEHQSDDNNSENAFKENSLQSHHPYSRQDGVEDVDIVFGNDEITFKKAKDMFEGIHDRRVRSLTIKNCELPSYIFNFIAGKLELQNGLEKIELSGCEVEISLLKLLAKSLNKWPALMELIISNNIYVDYSLFDLLNSMENIYKNEEADPLKLFDVSNCALQENDFLQIIKLITNDVRVERIVLDQNPIDRAMWQDLRSALIKNNNVKIVSLRNCFSDPLLLKEVDEDPLNEVRGRLVLN